jgi:hypothetical protein
LTRRLVEFLFALPIERTAMLELTADELLATTAGYAGA